MRRHVTLASCLALALGTLACQDQTTEPTKPSLGAALERRVKSMTGFSLDRSRIKLPSSARISDLYPAEAVRRAIDPGDYVCSTNTPVQNWFVGEVLEFAAAEPAIFDLLWNDLFADFAVTYEALLLQTEDTPQYFGYNGEYTKVMLKAERDVKRFWDIFSDDIQLLGMHGTMLLDEERVAAIYAHPLFFGLDPDDAELVASLIASAVAQSQVLNGGNHPIFSFNAFAFSSDVLPIPDKIVMGDGILAGYEAVGFADVAPQAIYAHEFAHHIQYENGYFDDPVPGATTQAELTRYTELMADAMSAYYLTHSRGAAMNRKRVEQFLQVFFQIGDCSFTNSGHHGTPNQRMRAAQFGFDVADQAHKQGHILTSEQFHDLFVAEFLDLVAPDAP
jgi:hypothetical protein